MSVAENIGAIRRTLPADVTLLCVSKFHPNEQIMEAYNASERNFGESRAQEMSAKAAELPKDIRWHFIGPIQTNKLAMIVPVAYMIHSVESEKQLALINRIAEKNSQKSRVLLEVHIAQEEHKHGFAPDEVRALFAQDLSTIYPCIAFHGLMGMASLTDDEVQIASEFSAIAALFNEIKNSCSNACFTELSIGMSHDYRLALENGSTMVRIGSAIFGDR